MAYRQSTTAMANSQYDVDLDVKDSAKPYKAGTIADQNDMRRVGKTQELRVRMPICILIRQHANIPFLAQLPIDLSPGIHGSLDVYLGGHSLVGNALNKS
jgi:hypothetical protein